MDRMSGPSNPSSGDTATKRAPARHDAAPPAHLQTKESGESNSTVGGDAAFKEDPRPTLSPRGTTLELMNASQRSPAGSLRIDRTRSRLQSSATTALSPTDVNSQLHSDGSQRTRSLRSSPSRMSLANYTPRRRSRNSTINETEDSMSILSYAPHHGDDAESILGDLLVTDHRTSRWNNLDIDEGEERDEVPFDNSEPTADFNREFDEIPDVTADGSNEGNVIFGLRLDFLT